MHRGAMLRGVGKWVKPKCQVRADFIKNHKHRPDGTTIFNAQTNGRLTNVQDRF